MKYFYFGGFIGMIISLGIITYNQSEKLRTALNQNENVIIKYTAEISDANDVNHNFSFTIDTLSKTINILLNDKKILIEANKTLCLKSAEIVNTNMKLSIALDEKDIQIESLEQYNNDLTVINDILSNINNDLTEKLEAKDSKIKELEDQLEIEPLPLGGPQ